MLSTNWQEEIENLKQELEDEIAKREKVPEKTVPSYLCINNLKSKHERLKEISEILNIEKYKLVFVGTIGEGKTTAICHLFNLTGDFKSSKTIAGKERSVIEVKELLATGSGRTTICEVIIEAASKTYIEIEPYKIEQMESMIIDFCESFTDSENIQGETKVMISKEIQTAIRNVTGLTRGYKTVIDGDKKQNILIDKAKEEFDNSGIKVLKDIALRNADLKNRVSTKIEFAYDGDERDWIKRNFTSINNGQLKEFAIPKKIRIYVSDEILSGSDLFQFQSVIDTKGIDENPIRKDLQEHLEKRDSICLFATNFKDAPETNIRELMKYYLSSKSRDFHHRFVTFVITHKGEPEKVNGGDGTWEVGTEIRREDIQSAFKNLNLEFLSENIIFYDALRYYNSEIIKLNSDLYTEEDVQQDRNDCIQAIASVVERRRAILREEVNSIKISFQKIKDGKTLTNEEIEAIEDAIKKIKDLRDLERRVPSFVYNEFIKSFISYYCNKYQAWNTKHAINRRFGIYDERGINIYYDARIVAEGLSEDEMLKLFTKDIKKDLESILNDLKIANKALEAFIPELIHQLDKFYDDFISRVGEKIEEFLCHKLSPQSNSSEFWTALINEKGKQRNKGETYTGNVRQILESELKSEQNLNLFLQGSAKESWGKLIGKVLEFFGKQ
jgi:hypothetical protein